MYLLFQMVIFQPAMFSFRLGVVGWSLNPRAPQRTSTFWMVEHVNYFWWKNMNKRDLRWKFLNGLFVEALFLRLKPTIVDPIVEEVLIVATMQGPPKIQGPFVPIRFQAKLKLLDIRRVVDLIWNAQNVWNVWNVSVYSEMYIRFDCANLIKDATDPDCSSAHRRCGI